MEVTQKQIDLYLAKYPDVKIETVPGADNIKLIAALASGARPTWPGLGAFPCAARGPRTDLLTELDPLIEKTGSTSTTWFYRHCWSKASWTARPGALPGLEPPTSSTTTTRCWPGRV